MNTKSPGANGLRGGSNKYSSKTVIGEWLDDVGGPGLFKRGFSTSAFETEYQKHNNNNSSASYYGSEVDLVNNKESKPSVSNILMKQTSELSNWKSTMKNDMVSIIMAYYTRFLSMLNYFYY